MKTQCFITFSAGDACLMEYIYFSRDLQQHTPLPPLPGMQRRVSILIMRGFGLDHSRAWAAEARSVELRGCNLGLITAALLCSPASGGGPANLDDGGFGTGWRRRYHFGVYTVEAL
ncbi:unnamed protein product [Lota lota]